MIVKVTAQQLYAEMDKNIPGWRRAGYPSFDAAVVAAGQLAIDMCVEWRAGFERKTNSRMAAADARKATNERLAQEIREQEDAAESTLARRERDVPVFDQTAPGRRVAAEWDWLDGRAWDADVHQGEFQPGFTGKPEVLWHTGILDDEDDDSQGKRGPAIGFNADNLLRGDSKPWSIASFVWDPVAPRSYAGSPKCY